MSLLPSYSSSSVENIKCYLRCKPLSKSEIDLSAKCIQINNDKTVISVDMSTENKTEKAFSLDYIFKDDSSQEVIFDKLARPLLNSFLQGYNCTIFAYGQTGSGKTHTILGPYETLDEETNYTHGLIPRILSFLFNQESMSSLLNNQPESESNKGEVTYTIKCSCLEIYQEHLIDLLRKDDNTNTNGNSIEDVQLIIRENSDKGMYIENLTKVTVMNNQNAKELLMMGMKNRHVARTNMNAASSRSHLIFTLFLESSIDEGNGITITRSSRLHLIDLAGSERQKATHAMGERIKEAGNINKSLSILGNVINALIEQNNLTKTKFVPFRDSKLTHFLKDSLGGNSKTIIIANISQSVIQLPETISTLKFVQRAKMITNKTVINENVTNPKKIEYLENEVKRLKEVIDSFMILQQNSNVNAIKEGANISHTDETNMLFNKLNEFIKYEEILCSKFQFLDLIGMQSLKEFYHKKEKYEKELKVIIKNNINNNASLSLNDINSIQKQELDLYKYLARFFKYRKQIESTESLFPKDFIDNYTSLHKTLKDYLDKTFKVSSDIILTDKKQFEQKSFQFEEMTITNEENAKMIEDLRSENFLLNMELSQYKLDNTEIEDNNCIISTNNKDKSNNNNIFKNQISEFSFTPTKSPQSKEIKDNQSNNKQFISNLRKSLMKSNNSIKSITNANVNEALIIKDNLDNALKAIEENERLISILQQHNSTIEKENNQFKGEIVSLKEENDTLTSTNLIYQSDIIRLNKQLASLESLLSNSINKICNMLKNNDNRLNVLAKANDDLVDKVTQCINYKSNVNEKEMIQYEKAILDLRMQRKQLIEEIKLLNDEFDRTLTQQEKSNAKIRIYTRIRDKSDYKKEYDDLVNCIFDLFPLKDYDNYGNANCNENKENYSMIDNRKNNKNAIDRLRKVSEVIEIFNESKTNNLNSSRKDSRTPHPNIKQRSSIMYNKSKSPIPKKK